MCELFAVSSKKPVQINDYLNEFYSHCEEHPHGWGLAIMQENTSIIQKQPVKATQSEELKKLLSEDIIVEHAFAHIRLATIGYMDSFNCHPFTHKDNSDRTWTLIHNGTIFKYEQLNQYIQKQAGETDSERILLYLIDEINSLQDELERSLNSEECFWLINDIITDLAKGNKLNIMIYNGETLFVHTNYQNSLHYLKKDDSIFISTKPLSNEKWNHFPINTVIGIINSEVVYKGKSHENEFELTEETLDFMFENMCPEQKQELISKFGDLNHAKEYILNNQEDYN